MDAANEICIVITAGQIADDDTIAAGRRGVNELTVSDVDTGVRAGLSGVAAGIIEEYQITGLQGTDAPDLGTDSALPLTGGGVGEGIAELLVNIHGEAGAVKTAGGGTAIDIAGARY